MIERYRDVHARMQVVAGYIIVLANGEVHRTNRWPHRTSKLYTSRGTANAAAKKSGLTGKDYSVVEVFYEQ